MNEAGFLKRERPEWVKLENYSARMGSLSSRELLEFISLYRRAASDLARARTLGVRGEVVDALNQLVGRIHFQIYTAPDHSGNRFLRFFTHALPQTVRGNAVSVWAALALLLLPGVAGYIAVEARPDLIRVFAPPQFVELIDKYGSGPQRGPGEMAVYTTFYIKNNIQVSFGTFVGGFVFGLGSLILLVNNGAILGAMLAAVGQHGQTRAFVSFVSAHGAIELFAIVLAGAAGLRIGGALINPGPHRRGRALLVAGREAGTIMFGVMVMLLLAAMLEAWISPSKVPDPLKWGIGLLNLGLVAAYFTMAGRRFKESAAP